MGRFLALAVLLASRLVLADNAFDQVAGRYPVYAVDGNEYVTGVLEISSGEKGIGYRITELSQKPDAESTPTELYTPVVATTVKKEGDQVVQEFKSDELSVRIEYVKKGTQILIQASQCPKNGNCQLSVVNNSNGAGEAISNADFFKSIKNRYKIELAGGTPPHGGVVADVSVSADEANLTFPYCSAAGGSCDPGYIDMALSDTAVVKRSLLRGQMLATIVWEGKVFTWEERGDRIYFRNYQYETAEGTVMTLSHELSRLGR